MRISDWSSDVCSSDLLSTAFMRDEIRLPSEYERSAASRQPGPESATRRCACASFDACPASVRMAVCRARDGYAPPASGNAAPCAVAVVEPESRSEEHTSELKSIMRIPYADFCLTT